MSGEAHRVNRDQFGRTAARFAASAATETLSHVESLVQLVEPSSADLLLDVACGPGRLLVTFALYVGLAVGVDLTPEMLMVARTQRPEKHGCPISFVLGEGERLPFRDETFTVVTTTLAVHHYADPFRVLQEMTRVCRPGGRIAISDMVGSPDDAKRSLQNEIERLRDPSHVEVLSVEGLERLLASLDLVITRRAGGSNVRELREWCRVAGAPPEVIPRLREMLLASQPGDRAGMGPGLVGDEVKFRHEWTTIVCRRTGGAAP
jgi:SAM-dependent methyltransferase